MGETRSCKHTSGFIHYTDFSGQEDPIYHGQCGSALRSTRLQSSLRSYELLYSHYSFMLHVILHACCHIYSLCFLQLHCVQYFNMEVVYINTLPFDASIAGKCMRWCMRNRKCFKISVLCSYYSLCGLLISLS